MSEKQTVEPSMLQDQQPVQSGFTVRLTMEPSSGMVHKEAEYVRNCTREVIMLQKPADGLRTIDPLTAQVVYRPLGVLEPTSKLKS